jgi:DNA (cytosine-5)-methyltransferase 1
MKNIFSRIAPLKQHDCVSNNKTVAEFFAGIGLMRMGLELGGWKVVFANDIDQDKFGMYSAHFRDCSDDFLLGDIHKLKPDQIPSVTMATASFPCNDLSLAGMRKGLHGKQSSAYWGLVRILDEMGDRRPPIVLLENVSGFLTSHGGHDFQIALLALNRLGYSTDAIIIDASRFVPQSRVRLFVIGSLGNGHANWKIQDSLRFYESDLRPKALAEFIFTHPEIVWKIRRLPPLPKSRMSLPDIIEDLPDDSTFWWDVKRRDYLVSQMSEKHSGQLQQMIKAHKWSYGTVFRRIRKGRSMAELRIDGLAGCLRTPRGGSGRQILVKAGYGKVKVRLLTPRECARLMGANDFIVDVPLNKALFGFGDAVCVPVIDWIAKNYLNPLIEEMRSQQEMSHLENSVSKNFQTYELANQRI